MDAKVPVSFNFFLWEHPWIWPVNNCTKCPALWGCERWILFRSATSPLATFHTSSCAGHLSFLYYLFSVFLGDDILYLLCPQEWKKSKEKSCAGPYKGHSSGCAGTTTLVTLANDLAEHKRSVPFSLHSHSRIRVFCCCREWECLKEKGTENEYRGQTNWKLAV